MLLSCLFFCLCTQRRPHTNRVGRAARAKNNTTSQYHHAIDIYCTAEQTTKQQHAGRGAPGASSFVVVVAAGGGHLKRRTLLATSSPAVRVRMYVFGWSDAASHDNSAHLIIHLIGRLTTEMSRHVTFRVQGVGAKPSTQPTTTATFEPPPIARSSSSPPPPKLSSA